MIKPSIAEDHVMPATYQESIEKAIRIATKGRETPGKMTVDVLAALGHDFGDAAIIDRQWTAFYASAAAKRIVELEQQVADLQAELENYDTKF